MNHSQEPINPNPDRLHGSHVDIAFNQLHSNGQNDQILANVGIPGDDGDVMVGVGHIEGIGYYLAAPGTDTKQLISSVKGQAVDMTQMPFTFADKPGIRITLGRESIFLTEPDGNRVEYNSELKLVQNLLKLFSVSTSRKHVTFEVTDGGLRISDHSLNGTKVEVQSSNTHLDEHDAEITRPPTYVRGGSFSNSNDRESDPTSKVETVHPLLEIGTAEEALKGEDTLLLQHDAQLFGVFDGAGGHNNADIASQTASRTIGEHVAKTITASESSMNRPLKLEEVEQVIKDAFIRGNSIVETTAMGGITTGTLVKIHDYEGRRYAVWASVGDSPLMVYNRNDYTLRRVSKDEILSPDQPNVITNCIGYEEMHVNQIGHFVLNNGDELIICSDGITGDTREQTLSDDEIIRAMQYSANPNDSANNLLKISRKRDDKTVIVIKP